MYNKKISNLAILFLVFICGFCGFIKDITACPAGSEIIGDACFWATSGTQTADSGNTICSSNGGGLALVPDQATSEAVKAYRATKGDTYSEYFIGYKVTTFTGTYVEGFNGGGVQTYTNWKSSQPNSIHQECITIYGSDGTWYDESCTMSYKALCSNNTHLPLESTTALQTTSLQTTSEAVTTAGLTTQQATTASTTTTLNAVTTSVTQTVTCNCQCTTPTNYITANMTEEIQRLVDEIKRELTVDKSTLSSTTRKYISAEDPRPSAAAVGSLGIILLTVTFGGLIFQDIPTFFFAIKKCVLRLKK